MARRNTIVGDDLDDPYLKGEPDHFQVFVLTLVAIIVVVGFWTGAFTV